VRASGRVCAKESARDKRGCEREGERVRVSESV
jgi:hypothetical protein